MMVGYVLSASADRDQSYSRIMRILDCDGSLTDMEQLDTLITYNGYDVHIVKNHNGIQFAGLNLFCDDVAQIAGRDVLDYVESTLLSRVLGVESDDKDNIEFMSGNISDLRKVSPETQCDISNINSRSLSFVWIMDDDKTVALEMPLSYYNISDKSRSEIENDFIKRVKLGNNSLLRSGRFTFKPEMLQAYGEDVFVLPGQTYQQKEINRNVYFIGGTEPFPIYDEDYPVESIANLFIYPFDNIGSVDLELTVLKHEYGDKETFTSSIEDFMAVCEQEGCQAFWGLESYDGESLHGSLFLCNRRQGYNHVVKIECEPEKVIAGDGLIKGKASLYIPSNNIESLFEIDE